MAAEHRPHTASPRPHAGHTRPARGARSPQPTRHLPCAARRRQTAGSRPHAAADGRLQAACRRQTAGFKPHADGRRQLQTRAVSGRRLATAMPLAAAGEVVGIAQVSAAQTTASRGTSWALPLARPVRRRCGVQGLGAPWISSGHHGGSGHRPLRRTSQWRGGAQLGSQQLGPSMSSAAGRRVLGMPPPG